MWWPLEDLKELENQLFLLTMKYTTLRHFKMEDDPTSFEGAMRSDHSSKWLETMEDEMKSMNANKVWDLKIIPKGAKTVSRHFISYPEK